MLYQKYLFIRLMFFGSLIFLFTACQQGENDSGNELNDTTAIEMDNEDIGETTNTETDEGPSPSDRPSPPRTATGDVGDMKVTVDYSSPAVKGRKIWDGLVPYGDIWRTGANEATVFQVNTEVEIEGQPLPAGKYSLFTIPQEGTWTIVLNKEWDQWGHFNYDEDLDQMRFEATPEQVNEFSERMKFEVEQINETTAEVRIKWENIRVPFEVSKVE